jgi:hypothetical protein
MNYGKLLAITSIAISVLACIGYLLAKDYRRAIYWASAACLTSSVTF